MLSYRQQIQKKPPSPREVATLGLTEGVKMSLKYNGNNIALAKNLRTEATPQENYLWYDFLREYEIRFQRQKAIGDYIVKNSLSQRA